MKKKQSKPLYLLLFCLYLVAVPYTFATRKLFPAVKRRFAKENISKHRRGAVACALSVAMVLTMLPIVGIPAVAATGTVVVDGSTYALTAAGINSAIAAVSSGGTIDIRGEAKLEATVNINKSLTLTSSTSGSIVRNTTAQMLSVSLSGSSVTLDKLTIKGSPMGSSDGYIIFVAAGANLTLSGGTAIQDNFSSNSAIYNNGTIIMNDATIKNNTTRSNGSGPITNKGTFTMNGGTITANTDTQGYSGMNNSGTFIMNGGSITANEGYGVYNYKKAVFTMYSGEISENVSYGVNNYGTFTMSGGAVTRNKDYGVYNKGSFNVSGSACVTDNTKNGAAANAVVSSTNPVNVVGGFSGAIGINCNTANDVVVTGSSSYLAARTKLQLPIDQMFVSGVYYDTIYTESGITIQNVTDKVAVVRADSELRAAVASSEKPYIDVQGDITINPGVNVMATTTLFSSNGSTVFSSFKSTMFVTSSMPNYGVFTVRDITLDGNGLSTKIISNSAAHMTKTVIDTGAVIKGATENGIYNSYTLYVNGGSITQNGNSSDGGGICNAALSATCYVNGSSITGNKASNGGGLYATSDCFINSGSITGNTAKNNGGGVYSKSYLVINGGKITGNTAESLGGGLYNSGRCSLIGSPDIIGNSGGNAYMETPLTIKGAFSGKIGVTMPNGTGTAASPTSDYTITENDLKGFTSDNSAYVAILQNGNIDIVAPIPSISAIATPSAYTAGDKLGIPTPTVTANGTTVSNGRWQITNISGTYYDFNLSTALDMTYGNRTLRYAVDYTYNGTSGTAYSNSVMVTVNKATPTLTLTVSPTSPAAYGDSVTLTATLNGGYNISFVQFKLNGENLGSAAAVSNGKATYTYTPGLTTTPISYTAVYNGDTNNNSATSNAISYSVTKGNQTPLTITSPNFITTEDEYTATTSGGSTGGAVTYQITGGTGAGSFEGDKMTVTKKGTIIFTATMAGNDYYNDAVSAPFTLTVSDYISVDITWGNLDFTYSEYAGSWNPDTLQFEQSAGGSWKPTLTGGDKISITNSSSVPISISFSYDKLSGIGIEGSFTDGTNLITAPVVLARGIETPQSMSSTLTLNGKPEETADKQQMGIATVTIGGANE